MCTHSHTYCPVFQRIPVNPGQIIMLLGGREASLSHLDCNRLDVLEEPLLICHPPPFIHVILCSSLHNRKNKFNNTLREAAAFCLRWE